MDDEPVIDRAAAPADRVAGAPGGDAAAASLSPPPHNAVVPPPAVSLDATPSLGEIDVTGGVSKAWIRNDIERLLTPLRECYRGVARATGAAPAVELRLSFEIDESGRATRVSTSGGTFGSLQGCAARAFNLRRMSQKPDTGTATVTVTIRFAPS
jgi:outer membrane biosynthesis protein TonB